MNIWPQWGAPSLLALFDLDGTLLDTREAHHFAAEIALARRGLPTDAAFVRRFLLAYDAVSAEMKEKEYLAVWRAMQPLYGEAIESVRPFLGVPETLDALRAAGHRLGVVTSKQRWAVERELRHTQLSSLFDVVVCRDDTHQHKPHPQPLMLAQSLLGMLAGAYVGDRDTDICAARAAGVVPIGAGWGDSGGEALRAAGAAAVLEEFPSLLAVLSSISGQDAHAAD